MLGRVAYIHGPGIDQPLGIFRRDISSGTWGYVTPHPNYKGEYSYGTLANGDVCPGTTGCPAFEWKGFTATAYGADQGAAPPTYSLWWGNILTGQADGSGLQYKRNRYYDPKSGRFTQLDPIGLGGGLNVYGFASGDPINFADPFGLKVTVLASAKGIVDELLGRSATAKRFFDVLHANRNVNLFIAGCSGGCPQMDVSLHDGGFFLGNIFRQDIWVDDVEYSGDDLIARLAHELVEAAKGTDALGTGIRCLPTETQHQCTIRYENILRREAGIREREGEHDKKPPKDDKKSSK